MDMHFSIETDDFIRKLHKEKTDLIIRTRMVAELIAREVVNFARSKTGETKPGVKPGDGPRKVHPGGWADITSNLANSIKARIEQDGLSVKAIVEATMEYAEALDSKTGYDVLGGADELARKAINKHKHKIFK